MLTGWADSAGGWCMDLTGVCILRDRLQGLLYAQRLEYVVDPVYVQRRMYVQAMQEYDSWVLGPSTASV